MNANSNRIIPKDPSGVLRVLLIGRVSTDKQPITNIEAGYEYAKKALKPLFDGPMHVKQLGEQGSGLRTDRATILEAIEEIETGTWDVELMEDVSKPYRNPRWIYAFVQDAVDMGCQVIAPGDNLDTGDDNWEVTLGAAALRHGLHIPDTRRRVRRTATHSFHQGGMVLMIRYGYRKLTKEEAASGQFGPQYLRLAKVPECTPIIREMKDRLLLRGESPTRVTEWLNAEEIAPGPYVKSGRWTPQLLRDFLCDPILAGTRTFRDTLYQPIFRSGKHRRRKNPNPETEHYAELGHMTTEEHQQLLDFYAKRKVRRGYKAGSQHPLYNQPRARSRWPGQHAVCGICGGRMYRFGEFLKCQNAVSNGPGTCWNHVQIDFAMIRSHVLAWVIGALDKFPVFRKHLVEEAWQEHERARSYCHRSVVAMEERIADLSEREANLGEAIAKGGKFEVLLTMLKDVEKELRATRQEQKGVLNDAQSEKGMLSREEVGARLEEAILELATTSLDFADLLRRLIPVFIIQPVQALDCPLVRPRAKLTLRLDAWTSNGDTPFETSTELDLFEPPVHIRHLPACVAAKRTNPDATLKEIAKQLSINHMTVKRALHYARLMESEGLSDPYRVLTEKPAKASRWKKRGGSP